MTRKCFKYFSVQNIPGSHNPQKLFQLCWPKFSNFEVNLTLLLKCFLRQIIKHVLYDFCVLTKDVRKINLKKSFQFISLSMHLLIFYIFFTYIGPATEIFCNDSYHALPRSIYLLYIETTVDHLGRCYSSSPATRGLH